MPCYMLYPGFYLFTYFSLVSSWNIYQEWEEYFCYYSSLAIIALERLIIWTKNIANIFKTSVRAVHIYILYGREEMAKPKRCELIWNTFTDNSLLTCFWKTMKFIMYIFGLYISFREIRFLWLLSQCFLNCRDKLNKIFSGITLLLQGAAVYILGDWKSFPINCLWKIPINKLLNLNRSFLNAIPFHDPF